MTQVRIVGREASHFTRVAVMFAHELDVPFEQVHVADLTSLEASQCLPPGARVAPRLELFRFPYGACNPQAIEAVNAAGLVAIQWDQSTGDPTPATSAQEIVRAMSRARPGSIIIAHANGRGFHTAEALPAGIAALKARGYDFVTVSELMAAGKPVVGPICYDSKPGDTDRYDHPLLRPLSRVAQGPGRRPGHAQAAQSGGPAAAQKPAAPRRPPARDWQASEGQWQMRILRGD